MKSCCPVKGGPSDVGVSPDLFAGLVLWLDASDASTFTFNGAVSEWRDKSPQANHFAQAVAGNRPYRTANRVWGKHAVGFNGITRHMDCAAFTGLNQEPAATVFCVLRRLYDPAKTDAVMVEAYTGAAHSFPRVQFREPIAPGEKQFYMGAFQDVRAYDPNVVWERGWFYVVTHHFEGADPPEDRLAQWVNGTYPGPRLYETPFPQADTGVVTTMRIGGSFTPGLFFKGDLAELVVYARTFGTADRVAIERYLAQKWGTPE